MDLVVGEDRDLFYLYGCAVLWLRWDDDEETGEEFLVVAERYGTGACQDPGDEPASGFLTTFSSPSSLTMTHNGTLLVGDGTRVREVALDDPDRTVTTFVGGPTTHGGGGRCDWTEAAGAALSGAVDDLEWGPDGGLYVAAGGRLEEVREQEGVWRLRTQAGEDLGCPGTQAEAYPYDVRAVTVGRNWTVYVVDGRDGGPTVRRVGSPAVLDPVPVLSPWELYGLTGILRLQAEPNGDLLALGSGPAGQGALEVTEPDNLNLQLRPDFSDPAGVTWRLTGGWDEWHDDLFDTEGRLVQSLVFRWEDSSIRRTYYLYGDGSGRIPAGALARVVLGLDVPGPDLPWFVDFEYDEAGRLAALVDPDGNRTVTRVDENGDLVLIANTEGDFALMSYDAEHRLVGWVGPDRFATVIEYNDAGMVTRVHGREGTRTFGPDSTADLLDHLPEGLGHFWTAVEGWFGEDLSPLAESLEDRCQTNGDCADTTPGDEDLCWLGFCVHRPFRTKPEPEAARPRDPCPTPSWCEPVFMEGTCGDDEDWSALCDDGHPGTWDVCVGGECASVVVPPDVEGGCLRGNAGLDCRAQVLSAFGADIEGCVARCCPGCGEAEAASCRAHCVIVESNRRFGEASGGPGCAWAGCEASAGHVAPCLLSQGTSGCTSANDPGVCLMRSASACCEVVEDCEDFNPCTTQSCQSGACVFAPVQDGTACDDLDPCTSGSTCVSGTCTAGTWVCGDPGGAGDEGFEGGGEVVEVQDIPDQPVEEAGDAGGSTCPEPPPPCERPPQCPESAVFVLECVDGEWSCRVEGFDAYEPIEVTCDGVDNDCDGWTDEWCGWIPCDSSQNCPGGTACLNHRCAPRLNDSGPTDLAEEAEFLYSGPNAIQTGVESGAIDGQRVSVLHGSVKDRSGQPLVGVTVKVLHHGEWGGTMSLPDGTYHMAVNGGFTLVVRLEKVGYLPVVRRVNTTQRNHVWLPDVVMSPRSPTSVTILASSSDYQDAQLAQAVDTDGERQATLLFPPGTFGRFVDADGAVHLLDAFAVRATEYTVGDAGPLAMPALLPANSAYTYCVALEVDESEGRPVDFVDADGAPVTVPVYVENFLGFPVGAAIPSGYLDRETGTWMPSDNGRVIKVLDVVDGTAEIALAPDLSPASEADLEAAGITFGERQAIADLYLPGDELWRVPVTHFTDFDFNGPFGPPDDAGPPGGPGPGGAGGGGGGGISAPMSGCKQSGSVIDCGLHAFTETVPIGGTPYRLVYSSWHTPSNKKNTTIYIPLLSGVMPESLVEVIVQIEVAGRRYEYTFGRDQVLQGTTGFVFSDWDGKDYLGRKVYGAVPVKVRMGYKYGFVYYKFSPAGTLVKLFGEAAWNAGGYTLEDVRSARWAPVFWKEWTGFLYSGSFQAPDRGFGGWQLDVHHYFSPWGVLYFGNGEERAAAEGWSETRIETFAGVQPEPCTYSPQCGETGCCGDGGPARSARFGSRISGLAVSVAGVFVLDTDLDGNGNIRHQRIRRIGWDGMISTVVDLSEYEEITGLAISPNHALFISDRHRIYRVDEVCSGDPVPVCEWRVEPVAGSEEGGSSDEGVPALQAKFESILDIAASDDGYLLVVEAFEEYTNRSDRVRRIKIGEFGELGEVNTVAGTSEQRVCGDCWPTDEWLQGGDNDARDAFLYRIESIATTAGGELFIGVTRRKSNDRPSQLSRIFRVGPDSRIHEVARSIQATDPPAPGQCTIWASYYDGHCHSGDGGPAMLANIDHPRNMVVDKEGRLYFSDYIRVRRIDERGIVDTVAGRCYRHMDYGSPSVPAGCDNTACCPWEPLVDGGPAREARLGHMTAMAFLPDGSLLVTDNFRHGIRRITGGDLTRPGLPGAGNDVMVPSDDGREYYVFDGTSGRHLQTRDSFTGAVIREFRYDPLGQLEAVIDRDGHETTVVRDTFNGEIHIYSPLGDPPVETTIWLDENGFARQIENDLGDPVTLTNTDEGFILELMDANGNVYKFEPAYTGYLGGEEDPEGQRINLWHTMYGRSEWAPCDNDRWEIYFPPGKNETCDWLQKNLPDLFNNLCPYGYVCTPCQPAGGYRGVSHEVDEHLVVRAERGPAFPGETQPRAVGWLYRTERKQIRDGCWAAGIQDEKRINTFPGGVTTTTVIGNGVNDLDSIGPGKEITTYSDGTVVEIQKVPDSRWGDLAPVVSDFKVTTPGGRSRNLVSERTWTKDADGTITEGVTSLRINGSDAPFEERFTRSDPDCGALPSFRWTTPEGRWVKSCLDDRGRVSRTTVPGLHEAVYQYDAFGRLETIRRGTRRQRLLPDQNGYLGSVSAWDVDNPHGPDAQSPLTTVFDNDRLGRVNRTTTPVNEVVMTVQDGNGNLRAVVPPDRTAHEMFYSRVNQMTEYRPPLAGGRPLPESVHLDYNAFRQVELVSWLDGTVLDYEYDLTPYMDQLSLEEWLAESSGRLESVEWRDENGSRATWTYEYQADGHLRSVRTAPEGNTVSFEYDGFLPTVVSWSGPDIAGSVETSYNDEFLVSGQRVNDGVPVTFEYDEDGLLERAGTALVVTRDPGNGLIRTVTFTVGGNTLTEEFTYNGYGEIETHVVRVGSSTLFSGRYDGTGEYEERQRDGLGRIRRKSEQVFWGGQVDWTFEYDLSGALTSATMDGALGTREVVYDYKDETGATLNGNRLRKVVNGVEVTEYEYDERDRLVQAGDTMYGWTARGSLESKTEPDGLGGESVTWYEYDPFGQLRVVFLPGHEAVAYRMDGLHRRVARRRYQSGVRVEEERYLYDGPRVVAMLDGEDRVVFEFVYGTRGTVPDWAVYHPEGGGAPMMLRIVSDDLGSPRLVVDVANCSAAPTCHVVQRMDFDEFGNVLTDVVEPGFPRIPFGFAGGLYDPVTGLVRFGARDYDPSTGRWAAMDPILFGGGDGNLYRYCAGDPVNCVDPSGLWVGFASTSVSAALPGATADASASVFVGSEGAQNAVGSAYGAAVTLAGVLGAGVSVGGGFFTGDVSEFREATTVSISLFFFSVDIYHGHSGGWGLGLNVGRAFHRVTRGANSSAKGSDVPSWSGGYECLEKF